MNSDVEDLFDAARRLKDPSQRQAFLDAACSQDSRLRRELEELLAFEPDAKALLDGGAARKQTNSLAAEAALQEWIDILGRWKAAKWRKKAQELGAASPGKTKRQ